MHNDDTETLEDALYDQQLYIKRGYIVTVYKDRIGSYIAACPTLHAATFGPSHDEALDSLDDAMTVAVEGHRALGHEVPPLDVIARRLP